MYKDKQVLKNINNFIIKIISQEIKVHKHFKQMFIILFSLIRTSL
jgi:hypothetical protein